MPRKPWVGGNWKCNLNPAGVDALVKSLNEAAYPDESKVDIVVAPSHIWLTTVASTIKPRFVVSAQDSYSEKNGAYTGAHSCEMLLSAGIKTTILGHSERRKYFHESNEVSFFSSFLLMLTFSFFYRKLELKSELHKSVE